MTELMRINHLKSLDQPLHRVDLSKFLAPGSGVVSVGHEVGRPS